jgi:RNA polymerase sigma factor (sigma-70 family)
MKSNDQTLSHLMGLAQAGDAQAYRTVLAESQKWLARYFARRINPSAIDDLVQDTLVSVHRKRASFDPARPYLPWLAAIARFRWIDQLRRNYRSNETELNEEMIADTHDPAVLAKIGLDRLLGFLPKSQAEVIRLVKIEGLSIAEAAAYTGQSEPLVKVNIHRGIKKMATLIESE